MALFCRVPGPARSASLVTVQQRRVEPGVLVEVILLSRQWSSTFQAAENENALLIGTACTLVWLAINRSTVAWFALRAPAGATYFPTWIEIGIVVACFAAGILFYALGVRSLPTLRAGVEETH
jgi:Ni/Fe-hydrogenase subunit HybB-like protein